MTSAQLAKFLELCVDLSAQRDRDALLSSILDTAMDFTNCDGGTLYMLESDRLHFRRIVTRSLSLRQGGYDGEITLPPVPLIPSHVCARSVLENTLINVSNVSDDERFDFSGARRYDKMTGYKTRSMLVIPLTNDRGSIIGVLQLINALTPDGDVQSFDPALEPLVAALASQAAISLTNMQYAEQVNSLLDSLVSALSTAIDKRTPYNANHTRNMIRCGAAFLDYLEHSGSDWHFTPTRRRAFLMSVGLHDVGKLAVPLEVMDKERRLPPGLLDTIRNRFTVMELLDRVACLEGKADKESYPERCTARSDGLALIEWADSAGCLTDDMLERLRTIAAKTYVDDDGISQPWLTPDEQTYITIRRGTLTEQERAVMENHVNATSSILAGVSFPQEYADVPMWVAEHHELLNGHGYPRGLNASELSPEVRLLTILDVFDALTASDRPYKPSMPLKRALGILSDMADAGELDGAILELFMASKAWEVTK